MRTILCALCATVTISLAAPASSQEINLLAPNSMKLKTQDEVDADAARNKDYQSSLKKLPDKNVKRDPWGNIRNSGTADADPKQKNQRAGAQ